MGSFSFFSRLRFFLPACSGAAAAAWRLAATAGAAWLSPLTALVVASMAALALACSVAGSWRLSMAAPSSPCRMELVWFMYARRRSPSPVWT